MAKTDKKAVSKKANPIKAKPAPPVKSNVSLVKKTADDSSDSDASSSEESSSEESDISSKGKVSVLAKATPATVKKAADSSDDSSSSGESSSDDSDDDEEVASVPAKATPATAKKTASSSGSDESSSEDSDDNEDMASLPAKTTPTPVKHASDSSDGSSDSEESSSEDSDEDEDMVSVPAKDKISVHAQTAPTEANKKRKADNESAVVPKKVKLANGSASAVTSDTETRSIFVGKLSWNVDNDWLAHEFAECGEIESASVQMDRNTGHSRGFGFVHFKTADAVEKALALNGKEIDGRAVSIDKSNPPDKKASMEKRAQYFGDMSSPPSAVLFVGNLSFGVNEDTLWETFGEHGDVKNVRVPTDRDTGKPKGFAYVEFSEVESAKKAHGALQGFELDGRSVRLDFSQPRDSAGGRGGGQGSWGGRGRGGFGGDRGRGGFGGDRGRGGFGGDRGRGGFGGDRGRGGFGRGGFGGDRGRGAGRGGRGGERGGRGRGRGARTGGIAQFEGQKITFD